MRPKLMALALRLGAAITLLAAASATAQTPRPQDCNVTPPEIEEPHADASGGVSDTLPEDSLTDRLATCGSVLNPPSIGDPDVIQPAPATDDPMVIEPTDPQLEMR